MTLLQNDIYDYLDIKISLVNASHAEKI